MNPNPVRYVVHEVHNFGGFFGGDTVTLTASRSGESDAEQTLTIDERAFTNVCNRHTISAGMVLGLVFQGERVERAELLGAATHADLRAALGPPVFDGPVAHMQVLSYRCDGCGVWVAGVPQGQQCRLCGCRLTPDA